MYQAIKVVPVAYFEAARIDGTGNLHIFWYIIVPQLKSQAAALCMLVFIEYWLCQMRQCARIRTATI